ncbi:hypothetical protein BD289DRAFT_139123 [Coniella lustricola]|uniref:Uncharacterized protein n=1 Tax=Coniella lustricola TaxID=2025994 RepID=A0A2T2ZVD2_9PEZI|nr:hypothetical protein BD289DRAFT_139123 [Coniella lustricola]
MAYSTCHPACILSSMGQSFPTHPLPSHLLECAHRLTALPRPPSSATTRHRSTFALAVLCSPQTARKILAGLMGERRDGLDERKAGPNKARLRRARRSCHDPRLECAVRHAGFFCPWQSLCLKVCLIV